MSANVSTRQHTSALISCLPSLVLTSAYVSMRQHTSAYASTLQQTSAHVSTREQTSAYASTRQHTTAHVRIRQHTSAEYLPPLSLSPPPPSCHLRALHPAPPPPCLPQCQCSCFCTSKASKIGEPAQLFLIILRLDHHTRRPLYLVPHPRLQLLLRLRLREQV
jgi:hypothetical protein